MFIDETERMLIRRLSPDDAPALTQILGDPEVMRHSVHGVRDEAATRRFLDWCLACYESHGVGPWALIEKKSHAFMGFCGLGPERVGGTEEINLGYRLARRYWGAGYATEAARAALAFGLGAKALASVVVIVEPGHIASVRVAEKAGFESFRHVRFHGRDVRLYRITRAQWSALHSSASPRGPGHSLR